MNTPPGGLPPPDYSASPLPAPSPPPGAPLVGPSASRKRLTTQNLIIGGAIVAGLLVLCIVLALTGELGKFMSVGILFVPLAALGALAFAGKKNMVAMVFSYAMLAIVAMGVLFNVLTYVLFGFVRDWNSFSLMLSNPMAVNSISLGDVFDPTTGTGLLWGLLLMLLAILVSAAMLLRPVRVLMSRIVPIDPDNFVHKIALSILTLILLTSFIPLIVLGGRPPLLDVIKNQSLQDTLGDGLSVRPQDLVYQFIWSIPATLVVAGWPIARNLRQALVRLGFVRPSVQQVIAGLVAGVVLAVIGSFVIDPGITWLWRTLGWQTTDIESFGQLMSSVTTPLGALLIGITAGIGEEMAVRGLLQPRIGLIASNLLFTGFHAFQYGVDALLSVFIVGLILGIIRARSNTTTSAIVHGTYDFVLVLWSALAVGQ